MQSFLDWIWRNNYLIGLLAMEACLCSGFPRRERAAAKWLGCTAVLFVVSTFVMQAWEWEGQTIAAGNVVSNVLSCALIAILSVGQMHLCFEIGIWNGIFLMAIADLCQGLSFNLYKIIDTLLLGTAEIAFWGPRSMLTNLIMLLIGCALVHWTFGGKNRLEIKGTRRESMIIILAVIILAANEFFNKYLFVTDPYSNVGSTMIVFRLYDIVFDLVTLYMLYNLIARYTLEMEQTAMQAIARQRSAQYVFSQELFDSINIKSHDLKKQIRYLRREGGAREDLLAELETATDSLNTTFHSGNDALDTVLTEKSMICYRSKIPFACMAGGDGLDFMRDLDIYTLFANLLDNAIEASQGLPEQERSIQVIVKRQGAFLSIHEENYFSGTVREQDGQLLTTKSDSRYHGFGVRSMRQIVEHYDGSISFVNEGNIFKVNILLPIPEDTGD